MLCNLTKELIPIPASKTHPDLETTTGLKSTIEQWLDDDKAEEIETIDLRGQSALADFMIIATGRSSRQTTSIIAKLKERLNSHGLKNIKTEGEKNGDWVILDTGDVIVHLFRPEVREFYNIEQMWRMNGALEVVDGKKGNNDGMRA